MIAQATVKESGCILINVDMSMVNDMYIGESPKFVKSIFTLAGKLNDYAPVIIFIDEIDTMLSSRKVTDHENSQLIKGTFMTMWDGLISSKISRIVVMGATNKPESLDKAIYRRMPIRISVDLPNSSQRKCIFKKLLSGEKLNNNVDLDLLSLATQGLSGSDLKEFCSHACMARYREAYRNDELNFDISNFRSVSMEDFVESSSIFSLSVEQFLKNNIALGEKSYPLNVHGIYEDHLS